MDFWPRTRVRSFLLVGICSGAKFYRVALGRASPAVLVDGRLRAKATTAPPPAIRPSCSTT
jgi:hypothetical protein